MRVAIVGGIGTGKSAVMNILEDLGAKTIYADKINRELLADSDYINLISKSFDNIVIDNKIDKVLLRKLIINNEQARLKLNSIAHPLIISKINDLTKDNGLYFVEIPLLSEVVDLIKFDKIWAITAPLSMRVQRVMSRDNVSYESAVKIIEAQSKEDKVVSFADAVIDNNSNLDSLKEKVTTLYLKCLTE